MFSHSIRTFMILWCEGFIYSQINKFLHNYLHLFMLLVLFFYLSFASIEYVWNDCRTSLSVGQIGMVGKRKNRRRTTDCCEMVLLCLWFYLHLIKLPCFHKNQQNMSAIWGDMVDNRPRGILAFYWLETLWEMHPVGLHFYLGIPQSVSATW